MKVKILHNGYISKINLVGCIFDATFEEEYYLVKGSEILALGYNYFDADHMYRFYPEDVQIIPETFKVGDKVRLKKEFYKEEEFKGMSRSLKKPIAYLQGKSVSVVSVPNFNRNDVAIIITDGVDIYIFPPCIFELVESEKKPVVEVKRKAKVGEWIKVVAAEFTNDRYKNGDVLQVEDASTFTNGVHVKGFCTGLYHREYVVLENYEPKKNDDATQVRKWTPEEIVKAKCFLAGELIYAECRFDYDNKNGKTTCFNFENERSAEAKCAPNDKFNPYIGAVVAYCKTCGVKIPEFITH